MDMYKKAVQKKLRFATGKGMSTVEDLYDMSLEALDFTAKGVYRQLKASEEESFVKVKTTKSSDLTLALDILKDVIAFKLLAKAAAENRVAKAEKKKTILAILADKQNEDLKGKSAEELAELLKDL